MKTIQELDVRGIEHGRKHPLILETYNKLDAGERFVLVNSHDPKPLFYQFQNERSGRFTWEYLEQGPEEWRIAIGKPETMVEPTVGELSAADFRKAEVFKRHGIDFCCGGKKTLSEASTEAGIDAAVLLAELNNLPAPTGSETLNRYDSWSIDLLIQYILENHHNWLKTKIPEILPVVQKVAEVHGENHPETIRIAALFQQVVDDLTPHMQKEELVLFPYLRQLTAARDSGNEPPRPFFGSVENPIAGMEADHDAVSKLVDTIRELSRDYTIPQDTCASYKLVYGFLTEFEADLHQHIHLENNLLFPKARALAGDLGVL